MSSFVFPNLAGASIPRVSVIRDLGTHIDSALVFNEHVSITVNAVFRVLGVISRVCRQYSSPFCVLLFFKSLVRSRLQFGSVIWNSLSISQATAIENVQKRMIRIVYDSYIRRGCFYNYESLLRRLALHKLAVRRPFRDFIFIHKVVQGHVNSMDLLRSIDYHVSSKVSRNSSTFYPSCMSPVSPLSRIQLAFNKKKTATGYFHVP